MRAANHFITVAILIGGSLISCAKKENKDSDLSSLSTVVTSADELPACAPDSLSQVYWVEEQSKFYVCNGSTFVEIKGEKGDPGEKGDTGNTGDKGPAGSPANSGVWVFDKDLKPIGVLMDANLGLILFTNGAFSRINLATGDYNFPVLMKNGGMDKDGAFVCALTETPCGGTCYVGLPAPRGSIVRTTASTFYVATGDEQFVTGAITKSGSNTDGSCTDFGGDVQIDGYPITEPYSFPEGITLPLKTPLSFGFKTEE